MKNMKKLNGLIGICILLFFSHCKHDEIILNEPKEENRTLLGYMQNNMEYSFFLSLLERSGYVDSLKNNDARYTVLALKNSILEAVRPNAKAYFDSLETSELKEIMGFHILKGEIFLRNIPTGYPDNFYKTINNETIKANHYIMSGIAGDFAKNHMITFSGSEVINNATYLKTSLSAANEGDYLFTNGVIHNVEKLIKNEPHRKIHDWLEKQPDYSIFVAGLKHFGLWDKIVSTNSITIFAPKNEAFLRQGINEALIKSLDPQKYKGARLFGCYLYQNHKLLIRDYEYNLHTNQQMWIINPIEGDEQYNQIIMGDASYDFDKGERGAFGTRFVTGNPYTITKDGITQEVQYHILYSIGITKENLPYYHINYDDYNGGNLTNSFFLGWDQADPIVKGLNKNECDYIFENAVFHRLENIAVFLREAKIN